MIRMTSVMNRYFNKDGSGDRPEPIFWNADISRKYDLDERLVYSQRSRSPSLSITSRSITSSIDGSLSSPLSSLPSSRQSSLSRLSSRSSLRSTPMSSETLYKSDSEDSCDSSPSQGQHHYRRRYRSRFYQRRPSYSPVHRRSPSPGYSQTTRGFEGIHRSRSRSPYIPRYRAGYHTNMTDLSPSQYRCHKLYCDRGHWYASPARCTQSDSESK